MCMGRSAASDAPQHGTLRSIRPSSEHSIAGPRTKLAKLSLLAVSPSRAHSSRRSKMLQTMIMQYMCSGRRPISIYTFISICNIAVRRQLTSAAKALFYHPSWPTNGVHQRGTTPGVAGGFARFRAVSRRFRARLRTRPVRVVPTQGFSQPVRKVSQLRKRVVDG